MAISILSGYKEICLCSQFTNMRLCYSQQREIKHAPMYNAFIGKGWFAGTLADEIEEKLNFADSCCNRLKSKRQNPLSRYPLTI
jgi:hypothetical protein